MFLVAVTGGIGSGKSTVSRIFSRFGCPVIDADVVAKAVVDVGKPAWKEIKEYFGEGVFNEDGSLDREKLGDIIFSDGNKRKLLNSITHPKIYRTIVFNLLLYFLKGEQFVILDLPLLFETGKLVPYMNTVIVVYCDKDMQIERLQTRNGYTKTAAQQRIGAQMPLDEKCRRATYVIDNNASIDELENQVQVIYDRLRRSKVHWKVRAAVFMAASTFLSVLTLVSWKLFQIANK